MSICVLFSFSLLQSHSLENPHGGGGEYIPPSMFKIITFILVVFTLILGITIPNGKSVTISLCTIYFISLCTIYSHHCCIGHYIYIEYAHCSFQLPTSGSDELSNYFAKQIYIVFFAFHTKTM